MMATGGGKDSNITIIGSDVGGDKGTHLIADNHINLLSAEQHRTEHSKNTASGFNAGIAASYGANGLAFGVTAGGHHSQGHGNGEDTTHRHSHIGSSSGNTTLNSGGDTNIIGSQVTGNSIQINGANLNIASVQDTSKYHSNQTNISADVTVGYGASGSADYSHSKINADYAAVTQQSGILAGDGGYQINVSGHTQLSGALITSTDQAEQTGKNQITSGTIGFSDLNNHSDYKGESIGIGIGGSLSGGSHPTQIAGHNLMNQGSTGASGSIGFGRDKGHNNSTTHSGINTGNITLTNPDEQKQNISEVHTSVTTDNYTEHAGYISNNFDKDRVQREIDKQREITQEFSQNSQQIVKDYVESKQAALRDKLKQVQTEEEKTALFNEIYNLQYERRLLETLISMLTADPNLALTDGAIQLAATKLREETLANSRKQPPIYGTGKDGDIEMLSNVSYESGYFDGVKLGGTRLDIEAICGNEGERCSPNSDGSLNYIGDAQFPTLSDVIDMKKNTDKRIKNMYGKTGGMQGLQGSMFGQYKPSGWQDTLVESFAGAHDILGGQMWGWYGSDGNTSKGRDQPNNHDSTWSSITAAVAIPVAAPVAIADLIPQNVIQAIFKLLGH